MLEENESYGPDSGLAFDVRVDSEKTDEPDEFERTYHQIWRDAHAPLLEQLLDDCNAFIKVLCTVIQKQKQDKPLDESIVIIDENRLDEKRESIYKETICQQDDLVTAWQVFARFKTLDKEAIQQTSSVHEQHNGKAALLKFAEFYNSLYEVIKHYYSKKELKLRDNVDFISNIENLWGDYNQTIHRLLGNTSNEDPQFSAIMNQLEDLFKNKN